MTITERAIAAYHAGDVDFPTLAAMAGVTFATNGRQAWLSDPLTGAGYALRNPTTHDETDPIELAALLKAAVASFNRFRADLEIDPIFV